MRRPGTSTPRREPACHPAVRPAAIDVSVVICTCSDDRWAELVDAVRSIESQTVPALDTIVAVDHNAALAARVREHWPGILVVENLGSRGVSATRNAGIAGARGEVIAFLDDDAVASPDWLERMLHVYETDTVMAVGGEIAPLWQVEQPAWFPDEFGWVVGCGYTGLPTQPTAVRNVIGTNMSFRREVFDAIGGFDSAIGRVGRLSAGCDETEFCIRARQRWPEREIVYDPSVKVSHRVPAWRTRLKYFVSRCYGEGRSKALVSERVGQRDALSSELAYTERVLPAGVARGLREALLGDLSGLGRAAAIVAGLSVTSIGFLRTRIGRAPVRLARY